MKKELKFIFTFLIVSSLLYIIIMKFYSNNLPGIGTITIATFLTSILNLIGIKSIYAHNIIFLPNHNTLKIILGCTGVFEMIILSSIVISYPTSIINKLNGILLGIFVIYILNMLRLVSISYILVYYTDKFDFIDRYLWQASLVIFISLTYTIWLKSIERSSS